MADNTARLILQVDAAVALAQSNLRALSRTVDETATQTEGSLRRFDNAHKESVGTLGSVRSAQMELMHVTRAMSDGYAAGMPISRLFFMELGRISEAATMAGGALGTLGKFLGGPWGMLVSGAVTVLGTMYLAHDKAADSAKKQNIEEMNLADALKALSKATEGAITSERQHQVELLRTAALVQAKAAHVRDLTRAELQGALDTLQAQKERSGAPGQAGEMGALGADAASGQVARLQALLAQNTADVAAAAAQTRAALIPLMEQRAKELGDPKTLARDTADRKTDELRKAFEKAGDNSAAAVQRFVAAEVKINGARDAEIKQIEAQASAQRRFANDNRQSGRQIDVGEASSIIRAIGGTITSGTRSRETQQRLYDAYKAGTGSLAAKPGTSLHESGQALDIAKTPGMSLGKIREAFRAQGVNTSELLDEGNHFHVGWGKKGANPETARIKGVRQDETFSQDQIRAQEELAKAQLELGSSAKAQADLAVTRLTLEKTRLTSSYEAAVSEKTMTRAHANELIALNDRTKAQEIANVRAKQHDQEADDALSIARSDISNQVELEQLSSQLLTTNKEKRDSQIRLLDLSQKGERLELENIVASNQATATQKAIASARLGQLNAIHSASVANINDKTQSPGEKYTSDLADGLKDVHSRIQQIEVDGLKGLENSLVSATTKALGLTGALGNVVGELIKIGLEREIIGPLANALFGGASEGGGGLLGNIFGSIFGGGKAIGGPVSDNSMYMVGEHGPELFVPGSAGRIIPNNELQRRSGGGGGGAQNIQVQIVDTTGLFNTRVVDLAVPLVNAGSVAAHQMTMTTLSKSASRRLA